MVLTSSVWRWWYHGKGPLTADEGEQEEAEQKSQKEGNQSDDEHKKLREIVANANQDKVGWRT